MNEYQSRIKRAYQGEIVGEGLYRRLSENCLDPVQSRKLELISDVEAGTNAVLKPIADRLGVVVSLEEIELTIRRRAAELGPLSWRAFIEKALADWPPYIDQLKALERLAPECDLHSAHLVVDHEKALVEFAHLEHAGSTESLEPLKAFLKVVR